jgi:stringent starvation protein B
MSTPERPSKHDAFLALLREGWTSLHLDARRPGVIVPAHLRDEAHLVLQYGHDLPIPIPDLEIDGHGVRATLSFAKTPHLTVVPWHAVYVVACDDGRGVLYHEDVPAEVSIRAAQPPGAPAQADEPQPQLTAAGELAADELAMSRALSASRGLRLVPADAASDAAAAGAAAGAGVLPAQMVARRRRKPQLRVVK